MQIEKDVSDNGKGRIHPHTSIETSIYDIFIYIYVIFMNRQITFTSNVRENYFVILFVILYL